jgi:translation initiation factor IF-2
MADKEYRLNKVAAELNISTANLVGHLQKKGFQVENKPTAKISDEMYQVLLAEFRQDKAIREESRQIQKQNVFQLLCTTTPSKSDIMEE